MFNVQPLQTIVTGHILLQQTDIFIFYIRKKNKALGVCLEKMSSSPKTQRFSNGIIGFISLP